MKKWRNYSQSIQKSETIQRSISPVSLPIHVGAHSGYKVNERPRDFTVDEELHEIAEVEDRWYEPDKHSRPDGF